MGDYILVGIAFAIVLVLCCVRCAIKEISFCRRYDEMIEKHKNTFL